MKYIFALLLTMFMTQATSAATPDEDIAAYIKVIQGDKSQHFTIYESMQWMGLSDPLLFDLIEQKLKAEAPDAAGSELSRLHRYVRELGWSGQPKYLPTIQQMKSDSAFRRHAAEALIDLPKYQKWNPIISNRASFNPTFSDEVNRVSNMLRADDVELVAIGAKRIYFKLYENAFLVDLLAQKVKLHYMVADDASRDLAQSVAWMVKGMGSSRDPKYAELLVTIARSGTNGTVARHAAKSIVRDYEKPPAPKKAGGNADGAVPDSAENSVK